MGVPAFEVGYTSATTGKGDHEVHQGHVVAKKLKEIKGISTVLSSYQVKLLYEPKKCYVSFNYCCYLQ
jgi:hypothetical protein